MKSEKVYIFDYGNVIERPMAVDRLYNLLECKISFEDFLKYWETDKSVIEIFKGQITTEERANKFLNDVKSKKDFFSSYNNAKEGYYQDAIDVINELKRQNKKIYLLSNLAEYDFEVIKRINIKPQNIIFFDDRKDNVEVAKKCGIQAYCVTGENIKETFERLKQEVL